MGCPLPIGGRPPASCARWPRKGFLSCACSVLRALDSVWISLRWTVSQCTVYIPDASHREEKRSKCWLSGMAELRGLAIPPHLSPVRSSFSARASRILVTHPRSEHGPVCFASRIICFLLGDLVSLFFTEVKFKEILAERSPNGKRLGGRLNNKSKGCRFQQPLTCVSKNSV